MKHLILGVLAVAGVFLVLGLLDWLINLLAVHAPLVVAVVCLPALFVALCWAILGEAQR